MTGGIDGGGGELEPIPLTFSSAERYVAVLEPLLHEEARAGVQVRGSCEGKGVSVGGEGSCAGVRHAGYGSVDVGCCGGGGEGQLCRCEGHGSMDRNLCERM